MLHLINLNIMNIKRNIIFSLENRKKDGKPIIENIPTHIWVVYTG